MAISKQSAIRSTASDVFSGDAPPLRLKLVKDDPSTDFLPWHEKHPAYDLLLEELSEPDEADRVSFGRPLVSLGSHSGSAPDEPGSGLGGLMPPSAHSGRPRSEPNPATAGQRSGPGAGRELSEFTAASQEQVDSLLVYLTSPSGVLHQQSFDQYQQTVFMMIQMLANLHREQMAHSRHEFDRFCQLLENTRSAEESARPAENSQVRSPAFLPHSAAAGGPGGAVAEDRAFEKSAAPEGTGSVPAGTGPTPAPGAVPHAGKFGDRAANFGPQPAIGATEPGSPQDLLLVLCRRLAAMRHERRGLWQWLLTMMTGSQEEAALP